MVLDPMSMRARGCGPFEGLLHTPSVGAVLRLAPEHKKKTSQPYIHSVWASCIPQGGVWGHGGIEVCMQ